MHHFASTALAASLAGLAIASPVEIRNRQTFTVDQVASGKKTVHPAKNMLQTYNKYARIGAVAPSHVVNAAAAQSGTVAANPEQYDESYLCPVSVGGQTLNLDFDTGSADLWVYSTLQPSSQTSGHSVYNPSRSGKVKSGYTWDIQYQDGSGASGRVYGDKVVVGGVTATNQAVEAATSVSSQFQQDVDNDGLLGLAFSSINTVTPRQQTTFFDTVGSTLAKKVFAVRLRKGQAGSFDFGFVDSAKYTGSITYTGVDDSQGFWQFTAGGYGIGSTSTSGSSIGTSIADTGTTLWYLPAGLVRSYYSRVQGAQNSQSQGGYIFPCSATLPSLTVKIGSGTFTVPGSYINYAPVTSTQCFGGIQSNAGIGMSIFGDIFLKAFYVVFDESTGSPRLGFAKGA